MKSVGQIEDRIRRAVALELERRLEREVLPHLCRHNFRQPLDHRRTVYGEANAGYNRISLGVVNGVALPVLQTMGLCMLGAEEPEQWPGNVCEDPLDAQRCPKFEHRQSAAEVYRGFMADVHSATWLKENLPEVSGLLWVIDAELRPSGRRPPWWVRVWMWFVRGPLREFSTRAVEISVYLPPPPNDSTSTDGARTPLGDGAPSAPL